MALLGVAACDDGAAPPDAAGAGGSTVGPSSNPSTPSGTTGTSDGPRPIDERVPTSPAAPTDPADDDPTGPTTTAAPADGVLEHPDGVTVRYPDGWVETGPTIATEFAAGATCLAATVVDLEPPADSGGAEAASVLQSTVQICSRPDGGTTLDEFMASTFGALADEFVRTRIGEADAYRRGEPQDSTTYVQHDGVRFQVLTNVTATPTMVAQRIDEVEQIVESVIFG